MRLSLLIFSLIAFAHKSFGQYEPPEVWHYKADISFRTNYIQGDTYRQSFQPGIVFTKGKSNFRVAPILQMYSREAVNDPYRPKLTGLSGIYKLQIPSARKFAELFLQYEATAQLFVNKWEQNVQDPNLQEFATYKYQSSEFFSSHTIGYGFNLNISRFYLFHSVTGGIIFSGLSGKPTNDGPELRNYDFRSYESFNFNYAVTLGIGYKFYKE